MKEWIWAAVGAIAVNGYIPGDWTLIQSALILIMLWLAGSSISEKPGKHWAAGLPIP